MDGRSMTISDDAAEIERTAGAHLTKMGCERQVNPVQLKQLSVSIARSRQSDMYITEQGEMMAYISLSYIAQACSQWGQIMGAIKGEGARDDEDND